MISDDKNSETIKVTKVLQFFSDTQPKDAKLGETIRFMHNPGDGSSVYWIQGTLSKRMNKYDVAKKSGWTKNRFRVNSISVISHWGDLKPLPETLTINLTKDTAWALGTFELPTMKKDDLALRLEPGNIPCDRKKQEHNALEDIYSGDGTKVSA